MDILNQIITHGSELTEMVSNKRKLSSKATAIVMQDAAGTAEAWALYSSVV